MSKEKFIELAIKYLSNEATFEEKEQLTEILEDEKYKDMFVQIADNWQDLGIKKSNSDFSIERGLQKLTQRIKMYEPDFNWDDNKKLKFKGQYSLLKVAALVAVFFSIAIFTIYQFNFKDKDLKQVQFIEKKTLPGQKSIVTLFDGTKVILNADSELKYPSIFNGPTREVFLKGEAYFEVIHNSQKPFIVHSGELSTTVLGTKFNVTAFPDESVIKISLVKGKVVVSKSNNAKGIQLFPNQQYMYDAESKKGKVKKFDTLKEIGWKDNRYIFDNMSLDKVLVKLGRAFGVRFELNISNKDQYKIKANFNNESLWTIIEAIEYATNLNYKIVAENNKMKKIIFTSKKKVQYH